MDIDSSMHAKLTRRHKEIKPKQLYAMAFDAFFGVTSSSGSQSDQPDTISQISAIKNPAGSISLATSFQQQQQNSARYSAVSSLTASTEAAQATSPNNHLTQKTGCQFDYFFCPEGTFQYGHEARLQRTMAKYRSWMNSHATEASQQKSALDLNTSRSRLAEHQKQDDELLNTAYAIPKSQADNLIIQLVLRSQYEDDKYFFFIMKPQLSEEDASAASQFPPSPIHAANNFDNRSVNSPSGMLSPSSAIRYPKDVSRSKSLNHKSELVNPQQRLQQSQGFESLSRRVNVLESENAELRALTQILKQQNLEMQQDMKSFQKALFLLTEKQLDKHKLTYKEFNSISKQFNKNGKLASNIIHHVEALTLHTVRSLTPKKLHLIYNRFKALLPYHEEERYSTPGNDAISTAASTSSHHLIEVRKKARELLEYFLAHPDRFIGDICVAWIYSTSLNQPKKAVEIFSDILESDSYRTPMYSPQKLSFVSFSRARLQEDAELALKDYTDTIRNSPTFFPAHLNRGNLYHYKLNMPEQALSDYSVAIHYDPTDFSTYYNLAILYFKSLDNPMLALKNFNKAIELNPKHSHSYNNRALLYKSKLNDPIRALKSYDEAIKLDPQYFLYLNRGSLKFENLHSPEEALKDFNIAIRMNPKFADAFVDRGIVNAALDLNEAALVDFDQALRLNPQHTIAQDMYRQIQVKLSLGEGGN